MRIPPLLFGCIGFGAVFAAFAVPLLEALPDGGTAAALRLAGLALLALATGVWLAARGGPVPRGATVTVLVLELAWVGASLALLLGLGPALSTPGCALAGFGLALAAGFLLLEALPPRRTRP
ncbi:hypothetical protein [Paracraurococcus ruber]|uniref:Uncharacterized protein n=1 Tax=Paracraurococcus ruber TaxID=77675 RepID=A0ABS1CVM2_9PROT|nr:hypothetical protein [Paracraurococcus ruber]MBK1658568.1 hypothetical protein [Paracraurococcus ruber]TDG30898.1 hypothetical protein E2C05_12825 [Paracraurococcus ruber]